MFHISLVVVVRKLSGSVALILAELGVSASVLPKWAKWPKCDSIEFGRSFGAGLCLYSLN